MELTTRNQLGGVATILGVGIDTVRRWDREGRIATCRDRGNRRLLPSSEIDLRGEHETHGLSARNRFRAIVTEVETDGLVAQVEMVVSDPSRMVAVVTRDSIDELGLRPGMPAPAIVKSTSIVVRH
jgi:molybdopterin-binding protein